MPTTPSTLQSDVTKVEATVKSDIATVESDVKADLAKTYSGKIVAVAAGLGIVIGFILKVIF